MIRVYYLLVQQPGLYPLPRTINWNKKIDKIFLTEGISYKQEMISDVLIERADLIEIIYPDILFIDFIPLFSDRAMEVLRMYEPAMVIKQVNLVEEGVESMHSYYIPILKEVDCLSDKTVFWRGRQIDKGVLIKDRIPDLSLFKIGGEIDRERTVVRADFAESFLKRRLRGISLKKMEIIQEGKA